MNISFYPLFVWRCKSNESPPKKELFAYEHLDFIINKFKKELIPLSYRTESP